MVSISKNHCRNHIQRYGILQHLKHCCEAMPEFAPLLNTCAIDALDFSNMLDAVALTFDKYSRHDSTHSSTILANIEQFLGEDRISCLSPTDAWLILMVVYMHDIGMTITQKDLDELEHSSEFLQHCVQLKLNVSSDLRKAAAFFLNDNNEWKNTVDYLTSHQNSRGSAFSNVLVTSWYARLLIADFYRKNHAQKSWRRINQQIDTYTHNGILQKRLVRLYSKCAMAHGSDAEQLKKDLLQQTNGYRNDYAHPRFVAILLRIGDLFDVDNNRFNPYISRVFGGIPDSSEAHYYKHMAIDHILISPERLEIAADLCDCPRNASTLLRTFEVTHTWFDWIEQEVNFLSRDWFEIVPKDFPGRAPRLTQRTIHLGNKIAEKNSILLNFEVKYQRAFEFMSGKNLYAGMLPFCREIIQNAFDATKKQLYRNIKNQIGFSKENLYLLAFMLIELAKNPQQYQVNLRIRDIPATMDNINAYHNIRFIVEDNGIGIDHYAIKRMKSVGEEPTPEMTREVREIPGWMKPTGEFGIGVHSIFAFSDTFIISTITTDSNETHRLQGDSRGTGGRIINYPQWIGWEEDYKEIERKDRGTTLLTDINIKELDESLVSLDRILPYVPTYEMVADKIQLACQSMFAENIAPLWIGFYVHNLVTSKCDLYKNIIIPSMFDDLLHYMTKYSKLGLSELDIDNTVNILDKLRIDDCIIWQKSENRLHGLPTFFILYFDIEVFLNHRLKNILLYVQFMPLTSTQLLENKVAFKGSFLTESRYQIELPYLKTITHILGREARQTINVSRDYLLTKAVPSILEDVNHMLDALLVYLARTDNQSMLLTTEDKGKASLALYLHRWLWSENALRRENKGTDEKIKGLLYTLLESSDMGDIEGYTYRDDILERTSIPMKTFLNNPLHFFFSYNNMIGAEIKLSKANPSSDMIILPDLLKHLRPNLSIHTVHVFKMIFEPGIHIAYQYMNGQCECIQIDTEQLTWLLSELKNSADWPHYIPCFTPYNALAISEWDEDAVKQWPLCQSFIRIPHFGVHNESIWEQAKEVDKLNDALYDRFLHPLVEHIYKNQKVFNRFSIEEIKTAYLDFMILWASL